MQQFWQQLNQRERLLVICCGTALVLLLWFYLVVSPLQSRITHLRTTLIQQRELIPWMQRIVPQLLQAPARQATTPVSNISSTISDTLQQPPLQAFPASSQQTSNGDIAIRFQQVPFTLVMRWLAQLQQQYGITIISLQATILEQPGMVSLNVQLGSPKQ